MPVMLILPVFAVAVVFLFSQFATVHAFDEPEIILKSSYVDLEGRVNIIGTVRNIDAVPMEVNVGVKTHDGNILEAKTYGRIIWPLTDSPFKIILDKGVNANEPFITDAREAQISNYNALLLLDYGSMAVGKEKAFVGTIKNIAPFDIHNVSVYAGIHSLDHKSQLDTVRSQIFSIIKPGEVVSFSALPDPAVRERVFYYSCAGLDFDDPINTLKTGDGGFVAYNLNAIAQISGLRYDNSTDSIVFGVRPYAPAGGPMSLQIPQPSQNHTVNVMLDGQPHAASIKGDGKTTSISFFVPEGDHQVQIQGVRHVPEFPLVMFVMIGVIAGTIAMVRTMAAFRASSSPRWFI